MGEPRRVLSLFDLIAIVVGIVIGAGIFSLPSIVAGHLGDPWLILAAWLAGGAVALIGVLCYAELTTSYPHPGGEYHFLTRAYGRNAGFLFGWARMTVMQTGSIAVLAFVFGDYATRLLPLGGHSSALYGSVAIVAVTAINLAGVREMKSLQGVLFSLTVLGIVGITVAGLLLSPAVGTPPSEAAAASGTGAAGIGLALIFVLFTYGGWNETAYVSAEVKGDRRNIVRALGIGIGLITLLYVAVNAAYLKVLGPQGMAASQAIASDFMEIVLGQESAFVISVLVMVVVLASLNVTIFTGARTNFALGRDFALFRFLAHWSNRGGAPVHGLLLQAAIALALVLLGTLSRRELETAVDYLAPVFWFFFLLTGGALFVLRWREPATDRPFRVPLYPLTPALFCLVSAYMLYSSLEYTGIGATAGVAVLAAGVPFLLWTRRTPAPDTGTDTTPAPALAPADADRIAGSFPPALKESAKP